MELKDPEYSDKLPYLFHIDENAGSEESHT